MIQGSNWSDDTGDYKTEDSFGDGVTKPIIHGDIQCATFEDGSLLVTTEGNMVCTTDSELSALIELIMCPSGDTGEVGPRIL